MKMSAETLAIFFFLIPGFLSANILDILIVRSERSAFRRTVEALVFSFLIYSTIFFFTDRIPVSLTTSQIQSGQSFGVKVDSAVLLPVALLALALPMAISFSCTHDLHMRFLRFLRITKLTSRTDAWLDVFTTLGNRFVVVNFKGGKRAIGLPIYHSHDVEKPLLYLYKAAWVLPEGKYQKIPGHGLFIVDGESIETVEFLEVPVPRAESAASNMSDKPKEFLDE